MSVGQRETWGYRPHLDGIRVVAVYLVVGFHAGVGRLQGGFIGVDVFFVLSGYLVTNLLLQDLDGPDARLRLSHFYSRRARRLLPAAAVNLVVTAIVFASIASIMEMEAAKASIRAAALYFSNWHFIGRSADYFAADIESSPVIHYWSLSVEEQFYLLWPLLLGGLWWVTRRAGARQRQVVRAVTAVAGMASVAAALSLAGDSLNRAYYGTDTRAYQLLAGAFLALTPGIAARVSRLSIRPLLPVGSVLLLVAIVVTAADLESLDPIERGVLTAALVVGLIVSLEASQGGVARWALSRPWVVYLGKISYGTYLWHWLVIVVLDRKADLVPTSTAIVAAVVATGLASVSYQLLELPIRTAPSLERRWRVSLAGGLVMSLLVGVLVAPKVIDGAHAAEAASPVAVASAADSLPVPSDQVLGAAWVDFYDYGPCEPSGPVACPLHSGDGLRAIVVGDSHAAVISTTLTEIAEAHDLDLRAGFLSYCLWPQGVAFDGVGPDCIEDQEKLYEGIIQDFDPDIVFLAHRPIDDPINGHRIRTREASYEGHSQDGSEVLVEGVIRTVEALRADGRTVVLFEPLPVQPEDSDTLECMAEASYLEECRYVATDDIGPEARAMGDLAEADPDVVSVALDHLVCAQYPICDPVESGLVVWRDNNHLTLTFARSLAPAIDDYLVDQGVFD